LATTGSDSTGQPYDLGSNPLATTSEEFGDRSAQGRVEPLLDDILSRLPAASRLAASRLAADLGLKILRDHQQLLKDFTNRPTLKG
jgi:hypothetical protein